MGQIPRSIERISSITNVMHFDSCLACLQGFSEARRLRLLHVLQNRYSDESRAMVDIRLRPRSGTGSPAHAVNWSIVAVSNPCCYMVSHLKLTRYCVACAIMGKGDVVQ